MSTTDLTTALAEIRERYRESFTRLPGDGWPHVNSADDVPRLLAAVDAALRLAGDWDRPSICRDDSVEGVRDCGFVLREAITSALNGRETSNA